MSVKIIYFVHGTTRDNETGHSTGQLPGELSNLGVQQSKTLAETVKDQKFDAIFCSDLKRAVDSAELNFPGREIIKDARLRECDYGDLNGAKSELVRDIDHINTPFPGGESMRDVEVRLRNFCDFLGEGYSGKTVAVVAHKAPQLALEVIANGKTWEESIETDWREVGKWQPGWIYTT